ncbi:MAG: hypothetical protein S4CHLAM7_04240 [Chlamydiae bacterium]|nr:hypothetical protein [Chlamydiota bacterium]
MTINNRLIQTLKCCVALLLVTFFVTPSTLSADDVTEASKLVSFSNASFRGQDKNYQPVNSWTPYVTWIGNVQDSTLKNFSIATYGVGFLYASKTRGNLTMTPKASTAQNDNSVTLAQGVGNVSYNRTPIYEIMYGMKLYTWLSVMFSIQNQNSINVQTDYVYGGGNPSQGFSANGSVGYQYRGQLGLNSLMFKVFFELPWVLVWKNMMFALYMDAGVGPGWQSWTDNRVYMQWYSTGAASTRNTFVNTLSQKISASCVYQVDFGLRVKPAVLSADMSFVAGCKYNGWGQQKSIGKISQQGSWNQGLLQPISAQVLYSFAPYVGVNINY